MQAGIRQICALLDSHSPRGDNLSYSKQISFVTDRPGHDFRYAVDSSKAEVELGWRRRDTLESGLAKTVTWYLENPDWLMAVGDIGRLGLAYWEKTKEDNLPVERKQS